MANPQVAAFDEDIIVTIDDGEDNVRQLDGGHLAIDQPDGGVVIQLNTPRSDKPKEDEDPSKFYRNLADDLDEGLLNVIAMELFEAVDADDNSRAEWLATRAENMQLLGLKSDDPRTSDSSAAVDGQSVVVNPMLLEAVLKGWANAQAELLPAEGPCKIANYGDEGNSKLDELSEAYQRDMNYYLTTTATEFVPQTQHMLLWGCYFGGSGFKKVYMHPLKKRPTSEKVDPEDLIVSDTMTDLASCERITHQISMRQSVMKRYKRKGVYRDVALAPPNPQPNQVKEEIAQTQGVAINRDRPEDMPYTLWEIQCELDLPEFAPKGYDGIPLPYLVTMDKDSQVILAIRRDWKPEDEECERKKMYVRYPYVPGPGFYGTGLASIMGNSTAAMTAAWRISLDTGMYANFPSFLTDKLAGRQLTNDFRLAPGTGQQIETGGRPIKEVVMELPYKDVTPGLMKMMEMITEQSKGVGGSADIPVGEGTANIPVGTMLAHIEQTTKMMAAAHKGQHAAMDEELTLISDLFREAPDSFWRGNKRAAGYWTKERLMSALDTRALVPKSDPNVPSHIHRVMRAAALVELSASPSLGPLLNKEEVLRRVLIAMREEVQGLIVPPDPNAPPPPEQRLAEAKAKEADAKVMKAQIDGEIAKTKLPIEQVKAEAGIKKSEIELARTLAANEDEQKRAEIDAQIAQGQFMLDGAKIESENQRRAAQTEIDFMKLGVEREKIGVAHREADIAERTAADQSYQQAADRDVQREQTQAQQQIGLGKLDIDKQKVGVAEHQAETQRHVALHPPKPAGGSKAKPKKKK